MQLAATQRTPMMEISGSSCRIVGECYPENIQEFSSPVMTELKSVVPDSGSYTVELELFYFNSSSAKFFFDFFDIFHFKSSTCSPDLIFSFDGVTLIGCIFFRSANHA